MDEKEGTQIKQEEPKAHKAPKNLDQEKLKSMSKDEIIALYTSRYTEQPIKPEAMDIEKDIEAEEKKSAPK